MTEDRTPLDVATEVRTKLVQEVEKLNSLGKTGLAELLQNEGIKGRTREAAECPLARYFRKLFPDNEITLYFDRVTAFVSDFGEIEVPFFVRSTMGRFIEHFDMGVFPYLIETENTPAPGQDVT